VATPLAVLIGRCAIIQKQKSKFSNSTRFGVVCTICLHVPQVSPVATQIQAFQACLNYLFDANFVLKRPIEIRRNKMVRGYATSMFIGRHAIIQKQKSIFSNSTRFGVACTICLHVPQVSPVATQIQAFQACLNYLFDTNFVLK
jgi:hypothetical protein